VKAHLASRVAAALRELGCDVTRVRGKVGEFTVIVGDRVIRRTNPLLYPSVARVVREVRQHLAL
jgi:hypothetical protein